MKKSRILTIILGVMLVLVMAVSLIACNSECKEHIDENNDLKCDNCQADLSTNDDGGNDNGNDGGNNDGGNTTPDNTEAYSFTVKDQNGDGVPGVSVEFTVNGKNPVSATTNDNGVATANLSKNAVLVQVEIMDYDNLYIIEETGPFTFEGTKSLVYDEAITQSEFVISVVDHSGKPVEGVMVQLCFGSICKTPKATSKLGKATILATEDVANAYVSINSLPTGYSLQNNGKVNDGSNTDYAKYTNFNTDNAITIVVDKLNVITITAGDLFGGVIENIKIDIYKTSNDTLVATEITDETGVAEFVLSTDKYYFIASHKDNDPRYTWLRHEEGMQEIESNTASTTFAVQNMVTYTFNVTSTDSDYDFSGVSVRLLNRLFEEIYVETSDGEGYAEAVVEDGVATIKAPYDVYYVETLGLQEGSYAEAFRIEKNGTVNHNITIVADEPAGTAQHPIVLHYGYNGGYAMQAGDILTFKVIKPHGAVLAISDADVKVVLNEEEYTPDSNSYIQAELGSDAEAIFTVEARSDIEYGFAWSMEVVVAGTQNKAFEIYENDINTAGEEVEVDLSFGKAYYTFYATSTDATLTLTSEDDIEFYINGELSNSVPVANGGDVSFYIVGEGEATFTVTYQERLVDYTVIVRLEDDYQAGVEVQLVYKDEVVATTTTNDAGHAIFLGQKEYVSYLVNAYVANIPQGYEVYEGHQYGAYFEYEEGVGYTTAYNFLLIRDGSLDTPYEWKSERGSLPQETQVTLSAGQEIYFESFFAENMPDPTTTAYYVYAIGNIGIYLYQDNDNDGNIDYDTALQSTFDQTKNASWIEVPMSVIVMLKVTSSENATFKLRCGTYVPDLTNGEDVSGSGTSENDPILLTLGEEITTPAFVQGTGMEDPGIET